MNMQAQWNDASTLTTLPNFSDDHVAIFDRFGVHCLPELAALITAQSGESHRDVSESNRDVLRIFS